uniref:G-protein coupled receptors family 1 profile domain-containing protein n=1 Tax=Otolemur garnettii TaxID=30611 RepID=H0XJA8_OTOGA
KPVMAEVRNKTTLQEFILEGFPAVQHLGNILFLVHLLAYLASLTGNTLIISITWADHRLHTPMYILLSSFSSCECCFTTTVIPKLLVIFLLGRQGIPFTACLTQAFSFLFLGATIFFLMTVMSLDRYLAICKPLYYPTIMNPRMCFLLITACLTLGFFLMVVPVIMLSQLSFCGPNVIPHFFCDFGTLTNLSCSDTRRQKAFSTCSSHLIVLSLMYGSCIFIYVKPNQTDRLNSNREAALVNTVVTPLLNPVIYTLRNKQVHQVLSLLFTFFLG